MAAGWAREFESLDVYRLSERMADAVRDVVRGWDPLARDPVGNRLIRATDSVGLNIVEGSGRRTYRDNRRSVDISRGWFHETRHWLRRAYRRRLLNKAQSDALRPVLDELGPRLNAYRKSIRLFPKPTDQ